MWIHSVTSVEARFTLLTDRCLLIKANVYAKYPAVLIARLSSIYSFEEKQNLSITPL